MRVCLFFCLIAVAIASDASPNPGSATAEVISAVPENIESPTPVIPEATPAAFPQTTTASVMEVEPRDQTPKNSEDSDREMLEVIEDEDDESRKPQFPIFPNMMPFSNSPFNFDHPSMDSMPHPPFDTPLPVDQRSFSPFPFNLMGPHHPSISPVEVEIQLGDEPTDMPMRKNPAISLFDALKPLAVPNMRPIHLNPFNLFGPQIHPMNMFAPAHNPMNPMSVFGFQPMHLHRPITPFGSLMHSQPMPFMRSGPPAGMIDSLLDRLVAGLPHHIQSLVESKHETIPKDHAHEPMVPKLDKKDDYYIITGWFPGVKKEDMKIKLEGSTFAINANVTAKDAQAIKDLNDLADIDEVDEKIDLPYAPDARFVKARYEEDKHTLTVVFPKETTTEIKLL